RRVECLGAGCARGLLVLLDAVVRRKNEIRREKCASAESGPVEDQPNDRVVRGSRLGAVDDLAVRFLALLADALRGACGHEHHRGKHWEDPRSHTMVCPTNNMTSHSRSPCWSRSGGVRGVCRGAPNHSLARLAGCPDECHTAPHITPTSDTRSTHRRSAK